MKKGKRWIGGALLIALIAVTMYLLLRGQSLSQLAQILRGLNKGWLLAGLGLMFVFVGCEAMCSHLILERLGHKVAYRKCLGFSFVGFYVSSITPSATGGQPAQIYYMSKNGVPAAHGALNMMLIAACYQVTVLLYALAGALFELPKLGELGTGLHLMLLYGTVVQLGLTAWMLCFMFLPNAAAKLMNALLRLGVKVRVIRDREGAQARLELQMEEYRRGAVCLRQNPGLLPALLGLTFLQMTALYLVPYCVYLAFGLAGHGIWELVGAQAVLTLATSSIPLPGAVGASEGGFLEMFALFFGSALVTPAVLASRGISFYAFLVISGLVTLWVAFSTRRRDAEKQPDAAGVMGQGSGRRLSAA